MLQKLIYYALTVSKFYRQIITHVKTVPSTAQACIYLQNFMIEISTTNGHAASTMHIAINSWPVCGRFAVVSFLNGF